MALAPTLGWLFVGRVISGITAASIATAYAYVADVTPPEKRAARFGLLGAAFGAGFVLGPALGGLAGNISPRLPFWIAAGLSLPTPATDLLVLPESLPRDRARTRSAGGAPILSARSRCCARTLSCSGSPLSTSLATSRMPFCPASAFSTCCIATAGTKASSA